MSSPVELFLMVAPLAGYFYLLAIWQAGRHPRVVAGTVDATLLALGVGGLILFGPFGDVLPRMTLGRPDPEGWLIWTMLSILAVSTLARRSARKLVIYHVDADVLEAALRDALGPDEFQRTIDGYEDRTRSHGIRVEPSPRWQSAVIEAYGSDPKALIRALEPRLRERLRTEPARSTDVAVILFAVSALTMLVPLTGYLLSQPHARAALRGLLEHLQGG